MSQEHQGAQLAEAFMMIRERRHKSAADAEAAWESRIQERRSQPLRSTIKERLTEERNHFGTMSDDDLAFETAHLAENIESLKTELHLWAGRKTDRPEDWQPRAERALIRLKGRATLCRVEIDRRRRLMAAQQGEQQLSELERQLAATLGFIKHAKLLLPPDVFEAIWAAVDAENEMMEASPS